MFRGSNFCLRIVNNLLLQYSGISRYSSTLSAVLKPDSATKVGDVIEVKGWVKSLRNQKEHVFVDLSDGSTDKKLQITVPKALKPDGLTAGASIVASGALSLSPKGSVELAADTIRVCGQCVVSQGYPFAPRKQYAPEYIRQHLHFRPRTNKFSALLRVRHAAAMAVHNHFDAEGFVQVNTPILTSNDCEGAGELFRVVPESQQVIKSMIKEGQSESEAYFGAKTFLTVSGQLHLEAAAHALSKVYAFGPTFRAENSRSRLHLSEFYMVEAEIAFAERLDEILNVVEKLIKDVTRSLLEGSGDDIERCREVETGCASWVDKKFVVVTYDEAAEILERSSDKHVVKFDKAEGLAKEHELFLVGHCGNLPVFVTDWPREMKPFYMKENGAGRVAAFDLLAPNVGEVVGGSLRESDYEKLKARLPGNNAQLDWYLDLRKFGGVPTGGFGLGFERYLQLVLGVGNIKDTIPFPRWPHNCNL